MACNRRDNVYACPERAYAQLVPSGLEVRQLPAKPERCGPTPRAVLPAKPKAPAGKWGQINAHGKRREPGAMNGTEFAYAARLELQKQSGEVLDYVFEGFSLRLGTGSRYEPDFVVLAADCTLEMHEVKGTAGWKLDSESRTKFIAAAERFPWLVFKVATKQKAKDGGGFVVETYEPRAGFGGAS